MCCGGKKPTSAATVAACSLLGLEKPDALGRVAWLGVCWRGVPAPLRVWLVLRRASERCAEGMDDMHAARFGKAIAFAWKEDGAFEGCGCVDVLKRGKERIAADLRKWF